MKTREYARYALIGILNQHSDTLIVCGLGRCTYGQIADQMLKLRRPKLSRTMTVRVKNKRKPK
jgi:hypothetical protein